MLYALLKIVVKIALKVFYKKVHIQTKGPLPRTGPLIVVANHPNTFMDPLVIAAMLKQQVYFLTNGSVFKSPWAAWLLKRMNMIPVYRKEDVPGKTPDNRQTFAKCWQFLSGKGTLLIFPEGSSVNERRLRKLKTGTARIALGYEAEKNFQGGLRILTVGLNYSQANHFRSELFVHVDEAIEVVHFASAYQSDPYEASNALTDLIRERLEAHLIITRNEEEDRLARQVEALYGKRLARHLELSLKDSEQEFLLTKGIVDAIHHFEEHQPQRMAALRTQVEDYWSKLERLGLRDEVVGKSEGQKPGSTWLSVFLTVLGFPVYLYGLLNNYIPYILPSKVARLITREEVYVAPIMMTVGIFSFSAFYALQVLLFHRWVETSPWLTLLYALSLPVSGFFVMYYWNHLVASFHNWRFKAVFQRKQTLILALKEKRELILRQLEAAKTDFLAWQNAPNSNQPTDKVEG